MVFDFYINIDNEKSESGKNVEPPIIKNYIFYDEPVILTN